MKALESYSREIEQLAAKVSQGGMGDEAQKVVHDVLDGQPSRVLRHLVPLSQLRETGAFFTGRGLADEVTGSMLTGVTSGVTILDPACGAGDLLLASARHLPISGTLESTLELWSRSLKGFDVHPEFILLAKARLCILAVERGTELTPSCLNAEDWFPGIRVLDCLSARQRLLDADYIVLNPPYSMTQAPPECEWASGLVSQAALFLQRVIDNASAGTELVAILPDVLRTGSRYSRWRESVEAHTRLDRVEIVGRFDALTDVDVFTVRMTVSPERRVNKERTGDWWVSQSGIETAAEAVGDYFDVRVGPVVPHRHPKVGPLLPYVHAQQLPTWRSVEAGSSFRRFGGTVFEPPFVVVRRTSRPGDRYRATGTVITGRSPVAVENHLLVLKPKSDSLADCLRLIENLRSPQTNDWLDERIRCRHLTVLALKELPWWLE